MADTKISNLPVAQDVDDDDVMVVNEDDVTCKSSISYLRSVFVGAEETARVAAEQALSDRIDGKADTSDIPTALSDLTDDSSHRVVSDTEKATWSGKQDALTFDNTPTENSTNPVKSGGVYTALASKINESESEQKITSSNSLKFNKGFSFVTRSVSGKGNQIINDNVTGVMIDKIFGYSYTRNQFYNKSNTGAPKTDNDVKYTVDDDGTLNAKGTASGSFSRLFFINPFSFVKDHYYLLYGCPANGSSTTYYLSWSLQGSDYGEGKISKASSDVSNGYVYVWIKGGTTVDLSFKPILVDLTMWFGAGNEPSTVAEAMAKGINVNIPYDTGTVVKSSVTRVESKANNETVDHFDISQDVLTYLADKGYGNTGNYLDMTNKKYYQGATEYDLSSYPLPNYLNVVENGQIVYIMDNGDFYAENTIDYIISTPSGADAITYDDVTDFEEYSYSIWEGNVWNSAGKHIVVPLTGEKNTLYIKTPSGNACYIAPVKSYSNPVVGQAVANLSDYVSRPWLVLSGSELSIELPKDAKYLIIDSQRYGACIDEFEVCDVTYDIYGKSKNMATGLNRISVGAMNVRDFGTGTGEGCPSELVSTNLPLWKNLFSTWLNTDFLMINEWYKYFDADETIDAYNTLLKQFYPYKYEMPDATNPVRILLSKHKCTFFNLKQIADVLWECPVGICNINGKTIAVVCWLQSASATPETRIACYEEAIQALSGYDKVIFAGDFNTEDGLSELETFTEAGYVLGNGGYWGEINTWPAHSPATPNDNIVTKGFNLELFEAGENISSDHKAVRAYLSFES